MADPPHSQKGFLLGMFADAKPLISAIAREFLVAGDIQAHEKALQETFDQRQDETKLSDGLLTREQINRRINKSRSSETSQAERKRKAKKHEAFIFRTLLHQMRERITELEAQMAKRYEALQGKYGDNVIGGMASAFLTRKELSGLETDRQILQALANKFLDENGEVKDQYKDLEEAKYVRDWYELQMLKPVVAQYDGRNDLTVDEKAEVLRAAEIASLADNKNKIALSGNDAYQDTVDQEINSDRSNLSESKKNDSVTFG